MTWNFGKYDLVHLFGGPLGSPSLLTPPAMGTSGQNVGAEQSSTHCPTPHRQPLCPRQGGTEAANTGICAADETSIYLSNMLFVGRLQILHEAPLLAPIMPVCIEEQKRWLSVRTTKSLRMFSSEAPTYLLSTSGPFTTFGSRPLSILPICRAISVLPAAQTQPRSLNSAGHTTNILRHR